MNKLRIKEIAKNKGVKLSEVAIQLGIEKETLSRQINNGNPTLNTLNKISKVLGVEISELFASKDINGYIEYEGDIHKVSSIKDIEELLKKIRK